MAWSGSHCACAGGISREHLSPTPSAGCNQHPPSTPGSLPVLVDVCFGAVYLIGNAGREGWGEERGQGVRETGGMSWACIANGELEISGTLVF